MKHLDLFSGIGGFALAASWAFENHSIVSFCEKDKFCQKVLNKNFPNVPIIEDIKDVKGTNYDSVDLITGGFPCQPFSVAGKQRGTSDDRWLWDEMFRIIEETKPRFVIAENVPGIVKLALDKVLADLESAQYTCQAFIIPACAVNAPHRRDRVWILAHSNRERCEKFNFSTITREEGQLDRATDEREIDCNTDSINVFNWRHDSSGFHKCEKTGIQSSQIGSLNPQFVEWMMGFPPGWTEIKD